MISALLALVLAAPVPPAAVGPLFELPCPQRATEVTVEIDHDRRGAITDARIVKPSGDAQSDRLALASAMTWKVSPATRDGLPVAGKSRTAIYFDAKPSGRCSSPLRVDAWTPRVTPADVPRLEATLAPGVAGAGLLRARWHRFGRNGPVVVHEQAIEAGSPRGDVMASLPHARPLARGMYSMELWQGRKVLVFQTFEVARH